MHLQLVIPKAKSTDTLKKLLKLNSQLSIQSKWKLILAKPLGASAPIWLRFKGVRAECASSVQPSLTAPVVCFCVSNCI